MMNLVREWNLGHSCCSCASCDSTDYPRRFPLMRYVAQTTEKEQYIDDLHMEVREKDKTFSPAQIFRAHITVEPTKKDLSKFGVDEERDAMLYLSLPVLEDLGLVTQLPKVRYEYNRRVIDDANDLDNGPLVFQVHIGDRFWFQDRLYVIQSYHEDQYWGNTPIAMYLVCTANLYRPETSSLEIGELH
jgi:hypothetical protein